MLLCGFLRNLSDGVDTFRECIPAMTDSKLDSPESLRKHMHLLSTDATRSHLSGRNVEESRSKIESSNTIRVPEDTRRDVNVQGERGFAAEKDRLYDSAAEFDDFEFFAVGVSVGEKFPSERDEREVWTD
jgi:hypothetical protein